MVWNMKKSITIFNFTNKNNKHPNCSKWVWNMNKLITIFKIPPNSSLTRSWNFVTFCFCQLRFLRALYLPLVIFGSHFKIIGLFLCIFWWFLAKIMISDSQIKTILNSQIKRFDDRMVFFFYFCVCTYFFILYYN